MSKVIIEHSDREKEKKQKYERKRQTSIDYHRAKINNGVFKCIELSVKEMWQLSQLG
jgi:hypothetical protein